MENPISITLTPAEKEDIVNALYFYECAMLRDLPDEELDRLKALLERLDKEAEKQEF